MESTGATLLISLCAGHALAQDRKVISTPNAPGGAGFSQAIRAGKTIYLAGQTAVDPKTQKLVDGTVEEQTRQALENLRAVLAAEGLGMEHIVATNVFMKDLNELDRMNKAYITYFKSNPPARVAIQVARLPGDAKLEIAAIAVAP